MTRCGNAEDLKQTQKDRRRNAPKPLGKTRSRQLSLPLPEAASKGNSWYSFRKAQMTHDQLQSSLFKLPSEIRQIIWKHSLGGHLLHMVRLPGRLLAIKCSSDAQEESTRSHKCWGRTDRRIQLGPVPGFYLGPNSGTEVPPNSFLPLLQTCRKIYTESVNILYSDNWFDFNHLDSITSLSQTVMPARLNEIQRVSLNWTFKYPMYPIIRTAKPVRLDDNPPYDHATWATACHILSRLEGLRELYIDISAHWMIPGRDLLQPLFDPLYQIRPSSRFVVLAPGTEDDYGELKDHHFELIPPEMMSVEGVRAPNA